MVGCRSYHGFTVLVIVIPNTDEIHGPIGEDTLIYVNWTDDLQASDNVSQIFYKGFVGIQDGDRPLSLFLIYLFSILVPFNNVTIIELIIPVLLSPALVLAIYFLTKELTPNILSDFSHASSPQFHSR